jgi:multiple sugar transport system substrate-binding protein
MLVTNNFILPIDTFLNDKSYQVVEGFDPDDIIKGMMDASGLWKDKLYGVASNTCIMFYVYRKDLFENEGEKAAFKAKYGYDLATPKDWNQYKDMAEFFTRSKGAKLAGETLATDFYGVTIAGKRHDAMTCEWLNYAWSFGGGIFDKDGNLIINSKENEDALAYFNEMKKYSPPGVSNNTWDEVTTQIQQGIVAMAVTWNDTAPSFENNEESKVAGKMGYGAIPVGKAPAAHYGAWSYYVPAKAKNPAASWMFLQWFNTPEVQKAIALEGGFPTLQSVYNDPELLKIPYWQASLEAYKISSVRPRIPEWNEMNNEMMLELSKVIADEQTPKQALDNLKTKYEKLLEGKLPVSYQ